MASTGTSLGIYLIIGVVVAVIARNTMVKQREEAAIDVSFHASAEVEPETKKEPPPPPPPRPANAAKRPGRKAPATPTAIPDARPDEAEPTGDAIDPGGVGEDFGDGVGTATAAPPPPPPPPPPEVVAEEKLPDPVALPDDATPCLALDGNRSPIYPEAARKKGIEGTVVLKLIIDAHGNVVAVKLIRGDEPFATAAMDAVRTWHYKPALVDGKPWATSLIIQIPFRIRS